MSTESTASTPAAALSAQDAAPYLVVGGTVDLSTKPAVFSAQDITQRLLALIQNIHSAQDISPELIHKHFGQQVWINPNDSNDFQSGGKITETWYYGLNSMRPPPGEKLTSLLFEFNDRTHSNADMTPVCVALEDYMRPLVAAGFTPDMDYTRFGEKYWTFTRDNLSVKVYLRGKRNPDDAQTCVQMAIIRALS